MVEQTPPRDAQNWAQQAHSMQVTEVPHGAVSLNVDGRRVVGPLHGFGQLWQKTYRIRLEGVRTTPEAVIAVWKANFPRFQPKQNRFFPAVAGVQPGEIVLINASLSGMPVKTGVMVIYADETSFTLATPQGHPESGWVTFSAADEDGTVVCQVQSLARANDPIYEAGLQMGAARSQENIWRSVLTSLAAYFGVKAPVSFTKERIDPRRQWRQMGNVWHNAAIRSVFYAFGAPLRWVRPHRKGQAVSLAAPADAPARNRAATAALTFGILAFPMLFVDIAGLFLAILGTPYVSAEVLAAVFAVLLIFAAVGTPLALIFGFVALRWAKRHPQAVGWRGRAIWGLIFGFLALLTDGAIAVQSVTNTLPNLHVPHF